MKKMNCTASSKSVGNSRSAGKLHAVVAGGLLALSCSLLIMGCTPPGQPSARATRAYADGVMAYNRGDLPEAKTKLTDATVEAPELIKARILLGDLFRAEGDYRAALSQYEAVVKLDPYSSGSYYRLGLAYQFLERFLEARDAYMTSLKINDTDVDSHMNLGLVYLALGDLPKAMDHAKRATELDPKSGAALANYGVVLDAVGDAVGAERAFLSSLEITGDQPGTLLNLGQNLLTQNRGKEAEEVLRRLIKVSDSSLSRKRLGDALALQGRAADAIEQYELALKIDPNYFPAMNDAGRVMIQRYRAGLELEEPLRAAALSYWKRSLAVSARQPQVEALVKQWERGRP